MPFAGYDDFDACVRANSEKDDPEAYCAAIKREVEGDDALTAEQQKLAQEDPCEDGYTMVGTKTDASGNVVPNCVPEDDVPEANLMASERVLAQFRNPGGIQRVAEGGDIRYKRVMLLSPGQWTDAGSEQTVDYTAEGIRSSAENFVDMAAVQSVAPNWPELSNRERVQVLKKHEDDVLADEIPLNLLHGPAMYGTETLDHVGHIPTDSIIVDDDGRMYGDLVFDGDSAQSETAIDLMDEVLEAAQDPGERTPPVGPSVEIPADDVDDRDGTLALQEAWFSAVGVVFNPASRPVELGTQARNRAIAMTTRSESESGPNGTQGVVYRAMQTGRVHRPTFNGTQTGTPTETPDADDFGEADLETVADHALASTSGFPPDDFDDVLGFVVDPETGDLSLPLMREVASSLGAAKLGDQQAFMSPLEAEERDRAWSVLMELAVENFRDAVSQQLVTEFEAEGRADLSALSRALQEEDWSDIDTSDYPDAAVENARMALDAREETGNPNDCGTRVGWERANQLDNGENLSPETVKRMSQFERHEDNKEQGEEGRSDCGWLMWKAWGGDEGIDWAGRKVQQAEQAAEQRNARAALSRYVTVSERVSTLLTAARHSPTMSDDLTDTLDQLERTLSDMERMLNTAAAAVDIVEQAEAEGFDTGESTAQDLVDAIQDMDIDDAVLSEVMDMADAFLNDVDADALDATGAEMMKDWLEEQAEEMEDSEDENEMGEHGMEGEDDEAAMAELEEVKDTLGQFADHMSDIKDMLAAREAQREDTLEELERRLSYIEDESVHRSLTGQQDSGDFIDTDENDADATEHEDVYL